MGFYYPEGYFGPVCDSPVSDDDIQRRSRPAITDGGDDDPVQVIGGPPSSYFVDIDGVLDGDLPFWTGKNCKIDADGNWYDCEDTYSGGTGPTTNKGPFPLPGFTDTFFVPDHKPDQCTRGDEDINIRARIFYDANGTAITKYSRAKSSPVTFPVWSEVQEISTPSGTLSAAFSADGQNLVFTGTGKGNVLLKLQWGDNPRTAGVAVNKITINGVTWTRGDGNFGGAYGGEETKGWEQDGAGTYPITYTDLNAANSPIRVEDAGNRLCLLDGHGQDCNANFSVDSITAQSLISHTGGYWSPEANKYAVWVNPMECTLPMIEQTVTYLITIPTNATYGFTFGCDDNATMFLNNETSPFMTAQGGIFAGGSYATPYTATRVLTAGTLKMTINCTNSAAGFLTDGQPTPNSLAYSWIRNPGGFFVKICQNGICSGEQTSTWVRSGPHPAWPAFMNSYSVYPSNNATLEGVNHSQTYNVNAPVAGTYTLECMADNYGAFSFDGTSVGTIGQNVSPFNSSFTTLTTFNITGVTAGPHSLLATVFNGTGNQSWTTNPAGVAFQLKDPSGNVILSSTDLNQASNAGLIWHTRMAVGYEYYTL